MIFVLFVLGVTADVEPAGELDMAGYELVWADEFEADGRPNPDNWGYERGFVRNEELQWYQPDNARVEDGLLIIEGRRERVRNDRYEAGSDNWRRNRPFAEYTSASLNTSGKHSWTYGRFLIRAKIVAQQGLWPAIWTLGSGRDWPRAGEIDIMEYYKHKLHANACWGAAQRWRGIWDSANVPMSEFPPDWDQHFHVWRMDWDEEAIKLYVDDRLLNTIELAKTVNESDDRANPFTEPQYLLLNLAIGGPNGGDPSQTAFPTRYLVDYVRVYQRAPQDTR